MSDTQNTDETGPVSRAEFDALLRLVNEFQPEMQRMGQDIVGLKVRLGLPTGILPPITSEEQSP